jgi:xanthine dehydrogenase large subunit
MSMGKSLPHDSSPLQVAGAARYVDDIPLPAGALHLAFGLSTCAHGEITAMDLAAVRAAPGVVAVFSAENLPDMPDCSPSTHDEPLLAVGTVHYVGQPVFLVAATSHLAARKAARLGKISYAERPALLTVDEALAANSRFESGPIIWTKGAPADKIAAAPQVIEGSFEVGGQEHCAASADERRPGGNAPDGRWLWRQGKSGQRAGHRLCGGGAGDGPALQDAL